MRKALFLTYFLTISCLGRWAWGQPAEPNAVNPPANPGDVVPAPTAEVTEEVETLLRGPVHEAFAEPLSLNTEPAAVVPKEPPPAVDEIAPEMTVEDAVWIPGYWAWDDDRQDFIWVSGVWRRPPQGRTWVPGEWTKVDGGHRWIAGYWSIPRITQVDLLPQPPASLEQGPTSIAPSDDYFWIPGSWQYRDARYAWRPGFWTPCEENWVWTPEHYHWRPGGYVHVPGFWDYHWDYRGTLFAPCYFPHHLVARPGYRYRPSVVVHFGSLLDYLWVRPHHHHYYFGDYYDDSYVGFGFLPWYDYHRYSRFHDPLFSYHRWSHRDRFHDLDSFHRHYRHQHQHLHDHVDDRPRRTFRDHEHHRQLDRSTTGAETLVHAERVEDFVRANRGRRNPRAIDNQRVRSTRDSRNSLRTDVPTDSNIFGNNNANRRRDLGTRGRQNAIHQGSNAIAPSATDGPANQGQRSVNSLDRNTDRSLNRDNSSKPRNRVEQLNNQGQRQRVRRENVPAVTTQTDVVPPVSESLGNSNRRPANRQTLNLPNASNANQGMPREFQAGRRSGRTFASEQRGDSGINAGSAFRGNAGNLDNQRGRMFNQGQRIQATPRSIRSDAGVRNNSARSVPNMNINRGQSARSQRGFSSSQMKQSRNLGEVQSMRRSMQERGSRKGRN